MENPYSADTPTGPNRPQHERIHVILRMIHDRSLPNATDFMEELEVTRRTIMRDLDYLRDRMKMPIDYDKKERGYYFSGKVEGVPLLEMRASDLLWFFVGQHFLRQAGDDELANLIRESFQRISGLFGSKVSVSWSQLEGLLSAKTSGIGEAELRTFRAVSDALARSRVIRFGYRKNDSSEIEQRQACPPALRHGQRPMVSLRTRPRQGCDPDFCPVTHGWDRGDGGNVRPRRCEGGSRVAPERVRGEIRKWRADKGAHPGFPGNLPSHPGKEVAS